MKFFAALFVVSLAVLGLSTAPLGARNGSAVPAIDNANRAQVAETYRSAIDANLTLNSNWSGNASSCNAGAASDTFDAATVEAINWFRRMAGLNPVSENSAQSAAAQETALMMHAQNQLSHFPGGEWECHTESGSETAGLSNLSLGIVGPQSIVGQIEDAGANNEALGHRRWLLYPALSNVGIGNTSRASTVQVINDFGSRHAESEWVAWPPAGFVPDTTVFNRWSLSFAGASSVDFSNTRVSVTENGKALDVRLLPIANGFGDPALGWEVSGANPRGAGDVIYEVSVSGLVVGGRSTSHSYRVTSFDALAAPVAAPTPAPSPATSHTCNGFPATIVGTSGDDILRGTPQRDIIVALGGHDTIDSLGGNDVICAGNGNDTIRAGWGNDLVLAGAGADSIHGGHGDDRLVGAAGRDDIRGGSGDDALIGGNHKDTLVGNMGTDVCWGRAAQQAVATNDAITCERGR